MLFHALYSSQENSGRQMMVFQTKVWDIQIRIWKKIMNQQTSVFHNELNHFARLTRFFSGDQQWCVWVWIFHGEELWQHLEALLGLQSKSALKSEWRVTQGTLENSSLCIPKMSRSFLRCMKHPERVLVQSLGLGNQTSTHRNDVSHWPQKCCHLASYDRARRDAAPWFPEKLHRQGSIIDYMEHLPWLLDDQIRTRDKDLWRQSRHILTLSLGQRQT